MEATGYSEEGSGRITQLLPGWSVDKVKRMGAQAAKLLLYYRPDLPEVAARQLQLVEGLASDCLRADLPFLVEPKSYSLGRAEKNPHKFAQIKPQLVIETARQVTALPIDVLKAEFPADMKYETGERRLLDLCRQLDRASRVPWVILSAGVDFEVFYRQVEIACKAGASGFLAGRALWQEATQIRSRRERFRFLETTVADRLRNLARVAAMYGKPWYAKLGSKRHSIVALDETWHQSY
jgi:tagatose 1,6-diphosphate aldolase